MRHPCASRRVRRHFGRGMGAPQKPPGGRHLLRQPDLFAIPVFPLLLKRLYGAARLCHRQTENIYQYQRLGGSRRPLEGGLTRYISTRGEAPTLGFCDVMLTGLARDGGLYVPETWPQLSPDAIAGFFGRPYWEVAVDVIRPFVAGEI